MSSEIKNANKNITSKKIFPKGNKCWCGSSEKIVLFVIQDIICCFFHYLQWELFRFFIILLIYFLKNYIVELIIKSI